MPFELRVKTVQLHMENVIKCEFLLPFLSSTAIRSPRIRDKRLQFMNLLRDTINNLHQLEIITLQVNKQYHFNNFNSL